MWGGWCCGAIAAVLLTFMVIISDNGNGNVKTCCQEVIIQLRQTRDSRRHDGGTGYGGREAYECHMQHAPVGSCCFLLLLL